MEIIVLEPDNPPLINLVKKLKQKGKAPTWIKDKLEACYLVQIWENHDEDEDKTHREVE